MTKVPVQSLIEHIKTAIDVDPWAKEMVEQLLAPMDGRDTDHKLVCVEDVLETIRDMAHHPDHLFRAEDLLRELERRLMRK